MRKREIRRKKKAPQNNRGGKKPGGWAARQQAKRLGRKGGRRNANRTVGYQRR